MNKNIVVLDGNGEKHNLSEYLKKCRPEKNKKGKRVSLFIKNMYGDILEKIEFEDYEDINPLSIPKNMIIKDEIEFLENYGTVIIGDSEITIIGKIKDLIDIELENVLITIE
jgi:hypothetical protein